MIEIPKAKSGSGYASIAPNIAYWIRSGIGTANSIINSNVEDLPPTSTHITLRNIYQNHMPPVSSTEGKEEFTWRLSQPTGSPTIIEAFQLYKEYSSNIKSYFNNTTISVHSASPLSLNNICKQFSLRV